MKKLNVLLSALNLGDECDYPIPIFVIKINDKEDENTLNSFRHIGIKGINADIWRRLLLIDDTCESYEDSTNEFKQELSVVDNELGGYELTYNIPTNGKTSTINVYCCAFETNLNEAIPFFYFNNLLMFW